jgi:hypothetical protein
MVVVVVFLFDFLGCGALLGGAASAFGWHPVVGDWYLLKGMVLNQPIAKHCWVEYLGLI